MVLSVVAMSDGEGRSSRGPPPGAGIVPAAWEDDFLESQASIVSESSGKAPPLESGNAFILRRLAAAAASYRAFVRFRFFDLPMVKTSSPSAAIYSKETVYGAEGTKEPADNRSFSM